MITTSKQLNRRESRAGLLGPLRCATVQLAWGEWGNRLMVEVARAYLADNPQIDLVRICEHAGWGLTFARSARHIGQAVIVGSANHGAIYSGESLAIREEMQARGVELVTYLNRGDSKHVRS